MSIISHFHVWFCLPFSQISTALETGHFGSSPSARLTLPAVSTHSHHTWSNSQLNLGFFMGFPSHIFSIEPFTVWNGGPGPKNQSPKRAMMNWLVVQCAHLEKYERSSSMGRMTSHIWNGKKCLKPPTSCYKWVIIPLSIDISPLIIKWLE